MSYTKNLTMREVYASIYATIYVRDLFGLGLKIHNDRLAISALEELILRGDTDMVVEELNKAFDRGCMVEESSLVGLIGRVLKDECREVDPILVRYGVALLRGDFMGPSEWVKEKGAEYFSSARHKEVVKKAHPWAAIHLWTKGQILEATKRFDEMKAN